MKKIPGKKYLGKVQSYDAGRSIGKLLMSDGTEVSFHELPAYSDGTVPIKTDMVVFTLNVEEDRFYFAEDIEAL